MSNYIVKQICNRYGIQNFYTFFIFGEDNNISLLKKFHRFVFNKMNFDEDIKEKYMNVFTKIQCIIHGFNKLKLIWRIKKAKKSSTDCDLLLNPLSNFPESQKVTIYHKGVNYVFRLTDMINIWITALCKSNALIPFPEMPKNPYTNIEFSNGELLKCYIHIRFHSNFMVPKLIQEYIRYEMNLYLFRVNAYPELVTEAIKSHLNNECHETLYLDCIRMISKYTRQLKNRRMCVDIPLEQKVNAVKILRPCLKRYLYSTYSCNPRIKSYNSLNLVKDLRKVFKEHVLLGRRVISINRIVTDSSVNMVINNMEGDGNSDSDDIDGSDDSDDDFFSEDEISTYIAEEDLFDNENVFFYQTFVNSQELGVDENDDDPMNQVD